MKRRTYRYRGRWNRRARKAMKMAQRRGLGVLTIHERSGSWTLAWISIREPLYTITLPVPS